MKVLLDECIPRRFKQSLSGHECRTVPEVVLAGKKNGELLTLAEAAGYEVFLTIDRGIEHEQNLRGRAIAIIVIRAKSSRLVDLQPTVPDILRALDSTHRGELIRVGG
jgi:predicted nuclease of predicted toxin-antitoxin system